MDKPSSGELDRSQATQKLITELSDRASATRRRAAKKLGTSHDERAGEALYSAFLKERADPRTWETQVEMARALGKLNYRKATGIMNEICRENREFDMLTRAAATAYVRLSRASNEDATPILELLEFAKHAVASGAFDTLGSDRMIPPPKQIESIIKSARNFGYIKGYGDSRYGVAVAAAGWPGEAIREFLQECLKSEDAGVVFAATSSLKGKYIKFR